jgi:cell division transport system ATP-binding protein
MFLFSELHRLGTAVVLATHSRELIRRWPFPVLHLERGRLIRPVPADRAAAE